MKRSNAIILSTIIAAGAAYLFLRNRSDEAPAADEQQQGGWNMDQSAYGDSRGYRNNNPLNIRYSEKNNWKGKVLANTDGAFEQFTQMSYGFRAALYLFRKYIRQGKKTVSEIVSKWAPPKENHTDKYISFVVSKTQMSPDKVLKASDAESLKLLAHAMAWYENGSAPHWEDIEEGWEML